MLADAHISSLNYLRLNHILKFKVNVPLCSLIVLCSHFFSSYFPTMILSPLHSIYKRHFEFFIFALDNNDLKSYKRCVLATSFIFISRLIAMAITLVTPQQTISHQLKSFILSCLPQHTSLLKRIGVRSSFLRLPWSSGIILYIGNLWKVWTQESFQK